eukprot:12467906-Alexandrium_andersonii.AAC.1
MQLMLAEFLEHKPPKPVELPTVGPLGREDEEHEGDGWEAGMVEVSWPNIRLLAACFATWQLAT